MDEVRPALLQQGVGLHLLGGQVVQLGGTQHSYVQVRVPCDGERERKKGGEERAGATITIVKTGGGSVYGSLHKYMPTDN